ncbi:hypothetical protein AB7W86_16755, partial [Providencia rettgeri]
MSLHASKRLKRWQLIALTFLLIAGIINFLDRASLSIANSRVLEILCHSSKLPQKGMTHDTTFRF